MNRRRLARLEEELLSAQSRPRMPQTEEGLLKLFLEGLPELTAEAFGPEDPRSDVAYLRGLSSQQMMALYREAMETTTERALRNPDANLRWFQSLPLAERIRLLTIPSIDWDWADRRMWEFAAKDKQR
jgi:hypothetical protein